MNYIDKISNKLLRDIDLDYLKSIKEQLPYWNFHYFFCLAEALNSLQKKNTTFDSEEIALNNVVAKASESYNSINISSIFE